MHLAKTSQIGTWQDSCSRKLLEAANEEKFKAGSGRDNWLSTKRLLQRTKRIVLADLNMDGAHLQGFDFSYCYIIRCSFAKCDLRDANFKYAIVKESSLSAADICGANFSDSDLTGTSFYNVQFDKRTNLNWASQVRAGNAARPALRQAIEEHRFRQDMKRIKHGVIMKAWNLTTDYGTSIGRLFVVSAALNILFSIAYAIFANISPESFRPPRTYGWLEMLILALQRFLNSGASIDGSGYFISLLLLVNTLAGLVVLGIFVALLSKKLIATSK